MVYDYKNTAIEAVEETLYLIYVDTEVLISSASAFTKAIIGSDSSRI
jgi:hypothetical protein